jgi:hypothetical protein
MRDRNEIDDIIQGAANRALLDLILPAMRIAATKQRWTVAVHGSLNRDIDLILVPWADGCMERDKLVSLLCGAIAGVTGSCIQHNDWHDKPHGRVAKTLLVWCAETHTTIDLSVMPIVMLPSGLEEVTKP